MDDNEELAIIDDVGFGMRDAHEPILWFGVRTRTGGSLQVFAGKEALAFVRETGVYDIKNLKDKPCIVTNEAGTQRFTRMFK